MTQRIKVVGGTLSSDKGSHAFETEVNELLREGWKVVSTHAHQYGENNGIAVLTAFLIYGRPE